MTKRKKPRINVTLPMVGGWLVTLSMVLTAVLPVLPSATAMRSWRGTRAQVDFSGPASSVRHSPTAQPL